MKTFFVYNWPLNKELAATATLQTLLRLKEKRKMQKGIGNVSVFHIFQSSRYDRNKVSKMQYYVGTYLLCRDD